MESPSATPATAAKATGTEGPKVDPTALPPIAARRHDGPPKLSHDDLVRAQAETLAAPMRKHGQAARILFVLLDLLYSKKRTLSKFKVLELVARVPYQAWEQAAYVAVTHVHRQTTFSRRIFDRILESRAQQDNEQWHLFIIDELIAASGRRESRLMFGWIPQIIAFAFYQVSWFLFVLWPAASYRLNADFEDHAEHEYMKLVSENPEWESAPFASAFEADYGSYRSRADVFRQIGHDERIHKIESEAQIARARFD